MKIGLNCQHLLIDNPAGPERFTINLYKHLALVDTTNEYTLYFNDNPPKELVNELTQGNTKFKYRIVKKGFLWTQIRLALDLIINPVDVFFTPIHTFPFLRNLKTKFVVMIHGLEYKTNNEFTKLSFKKVAHPWELSWVAQNADMLVVPSQATKDKLIKENWVSRTGKVVVINEGVSEEFHEYQSSEIKSVLEKYDLKYKKYLLFVSTIQPRKNIINLIKSFAKSNHGETELILVGKLGWSYDEIISAPKEFGVEKNVKFLNWVPQQDLPKIFAGAAGYTNMSHDEGFGLTVLEAMASNIPVAVSDIQAHIEVGADTILYSNPESTDEITKNINTILSNEYPQSYLKEALERSKEFTWQETAKKFIKVFSSVKIR